MPILAETPAGFKYLKIAYKYLKNKKEKRGKNYWVKLLKQKNKKEDIWQCRGVMRIYGFVLFLFKERVETSENPCAIG